MSTVGRPASQPDEEATAPPPEAAPISGELLYGAQAIAEFLGIQRRQVYHLLASGQFPHWKQGKTVCARRSRVMSWMAEQEQRHGQ